ncbi:MAG: D-alanine--D-alanine ligase [Actinobacteria bacterium]|nr:D-alanine--D-alanine ligase [Actinomycetota bacterium]
MTGPRAGDRLHVLLLFGGRSPEHGVSCLSARSVHAALDPDRYTVMTVGITRDGRWTLLDGVPEAPEGALPAVGERGDTVGLVRTRTAPVLVRFGDTFEGRSVGPVDVCFPALHGPYGEDGTVQGLLASFGVPYVGADVASSAIGIDKRQMKSVFAARGLPQVRHLTVHRHEWEQDPSATLDELLEELSPPLFTKPARQGSSIGIRRCEDAAELRAGLEEAFGYDRVAVVERALDGVRELECGVLGNATVRVTRPGETVHTGRFYDFDAKYLSPVRLQCPADVPGHVARTCMQHAREAYLAVGARGMARVDFFYVEDTGAVYVNEINTIPGLTPKSMFPPVWAAEGLAYPRLVDRLLELALEAARAGERYPP